MDETCAAGLIFFNNVGYLGMCGHATIGSAVTLHHMGRIGLGRHRFETPVGTVSVDLLDANTVRIENVPSYRHLTGITVDVPGIGPVTGDVAWGGNWFFLTEYCPCPLTLSNIAALTRDAQAISDALASQGITGKDGAPVDHIEMFGRQSTRAASHATSCSAPAEPMIAAPAAPARAPSSHVSPLPANLRRTPTMYRKASSAAASPRALPARYRGSRDPLDHRPRLRDAGSQAHPRCE